MIMKTKDRDSVAVAKLRDDLEYRLPGSNKPLGTIVLPRAIAEELLQEIRNLKAELEELKDSLRDSGKWID